MSPPACVGRVFEAGGSRLVVRNRREKRVDVRVSEVSHVEDDDRSRRQFMLFRKRRWHSMAERSAAGSTFSRCRRNLCLTRRYRVRSCPGWNASDMLACKRRNRSLALALGSSFNHCSTRATPSRMGLSVSARCAGHLGRCDVSGALPIPPRRRQARHETVHLLGGWSSCARDANLELRQHSLCFADLLQQLHRIQ